MLFLSNILLFRFHSLNNSLTHKASCHPTWLKVKTSSNSINIKNFPSKVEIWSNFWFTGFVRYFIGIDTSCRDKFISWTPLCECDIDTIQKSVNNLFSSFSRESACGLIKIDHFLIFPEKLTKSLRKRYENMENICEWFFWVFCKNFNESLFNFFEIFAC